MFSDASDKCLAAIFRLGTKMEVALSFETLANIHQSACYHMPEHMMASARIPINKHA
jgi:hypothetical protein